MVIDEQDKFVAYLEEQTKIIEEKINDKKQIYKKQLEKYSQELEMIKVLLRIPNIENDYIENVNLGTKIIMSSPLNLSEKTKYICCLFNVNYKFFTNDNNLTSYYKKATKEENNIDSPKKVTEDFMKQRNSYINLRSIILEDNTVGYLKENNYDIFCEFENIGFSNNIAGMIIDNALRNYEHRVIK